MIAEATVTIVFYVFAAAAILLSLAVVHARKLLRAAVALMAMLTLSAGFYVLLGAEFLAGAQVLVYVGGIVVLIVFAIMLTRSADLLEDTPRPLRSLFAAITSALFAAVSGTLVWRGTFTPSTLVATEEENTLAIGKKLLDYGATGYIVPFEVVSLLLLGVVLGGIVIARKTPPVDQPFTTGGDEAFEAPHAISLSQHEEAEGP